MLYAVSVWTLYYINYKIIELSLSCCRKSVIFLLDCLWVLSLTICMCTYRFYFVMSYDGWLSAEVGAKTYIPIRSWYVMQKQTRYVNQVKYCNDYYMDISQDSTLRLLKLRSAEWGVPQHILTSQWIIAREAEFVVVLLLSADCSFSDLTR